MPEEVTTKQVISQLGYEGEVYDIYDEKAHERLNNLVIPQGGSTVTPILEADLPEAPDDIIYLVYEDDTPTELIYPNTIKLYMYGNLAPIIYYKDADGEHNVQLPANGQYTINVKPPLTEFNKYNTGTMKSTITGIDFYVDNRSLKQGGVSPSFSWLFHDLGYCSDIDLRYFKVEDGIDYNIRDMFNGFGNKVGNANIYVTEELYQWIKANFNTSTFALYDKADVCICTPTITAEGVTWKEEWKQPLHQGFTV